MNLFTIKKESIAETTNSDLKDQHNNTKNNELSQIYDYINTNCQGYENRLKAHVIMSIFNINNNRTFRNKIEEIRQSKDFGFIASEAGYKGGYWIPKTYDEAYKTLNHLHNRAMEMLKTHSILKEKIKTKGIKYEN